MNRDDAYRAGRERYLRGESMPDEDELAPFEPFGLAYLDGWRTEFFDAKDRRDVRQS